MSRMRWSEKGCPVNRRQSRTSRARKKGAAFGACQSSAAARYAVGNLAVLPSLLVEPHDGARFGQAAILQLEPGHGAHARPGVGQRVQDGPIPAAPEGRRVDGAEELLDLAPRDLGRPMPSTVRTF